MAGALTVEQVFDSLAIRVVGPKPWCERLTIDWHFTYLDESHRMTLSNGALIHHRVDGLVPTGDPDLRLTMTESALLGLLPGQGLDTTTQDGGPNTLHRLLALLDEPGPSFAFVTRCPISRAVASGGSDRRVAVRTGRPSRWVEWPAR